jgi:histidine triad (HIT) family protein
VTFHEGCDFCEIVAKEEPARIVWRSSTVIAFFPLEPATLGHTLVIPTEHIPDIWGLDEATAIRLTQATLRVAEAVRTAVSPDGLNLIQSNGAAATQTVDHLHVHVVPRWNGDAMGHIWPSEPEDPERSEGDMAREGKALQAIRDAMRDRA